jgi:hypothetical protein
MPPPLRPFDFSIATAGMLRHLPESRRLLI